MTSRVGGTAFAVSSVFLRRMEHGPRRVQGLSKRTRRPTVRRCKRPRADGGKKRQTSAPLAVEDLATLETLDLASLRTSLMHWYVQHHRDLPWRRSPGDGELKQHDAQLFAYAVWVSEVMLQQTQVVKVMDYFLRWMDRWPSVEALAQASLEEVREIWSGLGYYSRAANLLKGAQYVATTWQGQLPRQAKALQRIPGVGPYTSRAIASIAFGETEAVVDGNVVRVLSRLFAAEGDPKKQTRRFQALADALLDQERPGDFNQAVMELGAVVCRPSNPQCDACVLQSHCRAYQTALVRGGAGEDVVRLVTAYPMTTKKAAKKDVAVAVCVLRAVPPGDGEEAWYLLLKRPKTGLLAGLWEFPTATLEEADTPGAALDVFLNGTLASDFGSAAGPRARLGEVVHLFTHLRMTLHVETLDVAASPTTLPLRDTLEHKWIREEDMDAVGLCTMVRKVYNLVRQNHEQNRK